MKQKNLKDLRKITAVLLAATKERGTEVNEQKTKPLCSCLTSRMRDKRQKKDTENKSSESMVNSIRHGRNEINKRYLQKEIRSTTNSRQACSRIFWLPTNYLCIYLYKFHFVRFNFV